MNAINHQLPLHQIPLDSAIAEACDAIAPSWPLDRLIAVNPYWGWIDRPFEAANAELTRLAGSSLFMPKAYFRQAWQTGEITRADLRRALEDARNPGTEGELTAALEDAGSQPIRLPMLSDALDAKRDLRHEPAWSDTITHQISQFCAAYFDHDQADWRPASQDGLYASWRRAVVAERGVGLLMRVPELLRKADELPADPRDMIAYALDTLDVAALHVPDLLRAALLRIGGWASWCAYLRWQARLEGADDRNIVDLLAIRLAWETMLDDGARDDASVWRQWQSAWCRAMLDEDRSANASVAVWQRALECANQRRLAAALARAPGSESESAAPLAQAVFCIDVRSEPFRRALEHCEPGVQTIGFAGFFGLPVDYTPLGTQATRPQLPGLLAPSLQLVDSCGAAAADQALVRKRRARLGRGAARQPFLRLPGSAFALVESLGLCYLGKMLRASLPSTGAARAPHHHGLEASELRNVRPRLRIDGEQARERRIGLAENVLRAMGLTTVFSRLVLLVGHGSQSANNPHAAALDCGACCGQTGEVNARALAELLNDPAVREGLAGRSIRIPVTTHFLPALHNTTTDDVTLFDTDLVPSSHAGELRRMQRALGAAGQQVRAERAPALGLPHLVRRPRALVKTLRSRANDWAQTRPEWGLANNAAFVVAPRARTRGVDLAGRCFLHDYDWRRDADGSVLELIMTAPMIVTHWINMQYYASTVDPLRFGSGNKLLHNVVGGRIGVFEGNGGDLRVGLPLQSVHDGERWMHTPLRLSVFIEAPRAAIDDVIAKHRLVRQLIEHRWLHLFRLDGELLESYAGGRWCAWDSAER